MFVVDEATAQAIRQAVEDGGEVAGVAELRRHYRLMEGNPAALQCVRVIAGWKPPGERAALRSDPAAGLPSTVARTGPQTDPMSPVRDVL